MLRNATPLRKSAPGPPNISDGTCLLHCVCHGKCIFADLLQMSYACRRFWKCYKTLTFFLLLARCTIPCACHKKRHLNVKKWSEHVIATSKSGPELVCFVHFDFDMSKSGPSMACFVHFDFDMCFTPQRRALFRHLNSKSCAFWLRNMLRATAACIFSSLIWPAGSAPAALASLLFDPLEPQIIGKTQCFATFPPFRAPASSFFWLFLFSDLLSSALLFSILLLPLCFSSVHTVGSLNFLRLYV